MANSKIQLEDICKNCGQQYGEHQHATNSCPNVNSDKPGLYLTTRFESVGDRFGADWTLEMLAFDKGTLVEFYKISQKLNVQLAQRLQVFVDKYNAAPDGELGIGLVNDDFFQARDLLKQIQL